MVPKGWPSWLQNPGDHQGNISWAMGGAGFPKGAVLHVQSTSSLLDGAFKATSDLLSQRPSSLITFWLLGRSGAALAQSCTLCLRGQCFVRAQLNLAAPSPAFHGLV